MKQCNSHFSYPDIFLPNDVQITEDALQQDVPKSYKIRTCSKINVRPYNYCKILARSYIIN